MLVLSHKQLEVYKLATLLVKETYKITQSFPKHEMFGLIPQIRRASVSVVSNVAEGAARISKGEKKRFYTIARSSLVEVDAQFELAGVLGYYEEGNIKEAES